MAGRAAAKSVSPFRRHRSYFLDNSIPAHSPLLVFKPLIFGSVFDGFTRTFASDGDQKIFLVPLPPTTLYTLPILLSNFSITHSSHSIKRMIHSRNLFLLNKLFTNSILTLHLFTLCFILFHVTFVYMYILYKRCSFTNHD